MELLPDDGKGRVLTAVYAYKGMCETPDLDLAEKITFSFIRAQLDRDAAKYEAKCERNRQNGIKGGRPPKATETEDNPQEPKETERLFSKPKKPDTDTITRTDTETGTNIKNFLPGAGTAPDRKEPPFIEISLNDNSKYALYSKDVEQWKSLYPAVNIEQELRNYAGWTDANPRKRKTRNGIRKSINAWLAKEQDRGGKSNQQNKDRDPATGIKFAN